MKPTTRRFSTSGVRVLDDDSDPVHDRRTFLKSLAAQGLAIPGAYLLLNGEAHSHNAGQPYGDQTAASLKASALAGRRTILRDFSDPFLELVRLLRQASEVEHALMVQYLYAGFSVKPAYAAIAGTGAPNSNDLLGIAVMEMQHLRQVNELLMAIGGSPNLFRQDFPYEPEVYPFKFQMEPLSRHSLAKYVYTEAATGSLDQANATSLADRDFLKRLERALGPGVRPNHVGSLYDALIHTLGEYMEHSKAHSLRPWIAKLEAIKQEGEDGHFKFFRKLFSGSHESFKRYPDIWSLPRNDPAYPAYQLPVNPSAFIGHENQLKDPVAQSLAWLGNLHYWLILLMADAAFTEKNTQFSALARMQMMGPFMSVARHLPTLGAGIPCEPLCIGYSPSSTPSARVGFITCMIHEANATAHRLKDRLPSDYPIAMAQHSLSILSGLHNSPSAAERGSAKKRPLTATSARQGA